METTTRTNPRTEFTPDLAEKLRVTIARDMLQLKAVASEMGITYERLASIMRTRETIKVNLNTYKAIMEWLARNA